MCGPFLWAPRACSAGLLVEPTSSACSPFSEGAPDAEAQGGKTTEPTICCTPVPDPSSRDGLTSRPTRDLARAEEAERLLRRSGCAHLPGPTSFRPLVCFPERSPGEGQCLGVFNPEQHPATLGPWLCSSRSLGVFGKPRSGGEGPWGSGQGTSGVLALGALSLPWYRLLCQWPLPCASSEGLAASMCTLLYSLELACKEFSCPDYGEATWGRPRGEATWRDHRERSVNLAREKRALVIQLKNVSLVRTLREEGKMLDNHQD